MRPFRARSLWELEQVVFGSATQGVWQGDRKVRSLVVSEDRRQLPGKKLLGRLEKEENEGEAPTERRE